ncbi:MAG: hypothetical protein HRT44_10540 [Bdellovibrionales bacterium]|nr:SH3 domain-containing protein [Bdellovibrionales bacterium]NQZ19678.1 hypothetical protein [Bdellovibrionales bacterium]
MSKLGLLAIVFVLSIPNYSSALCVIKDQANLRMKPSSKSKLAWTVGKYMPLKEVKQKGDWYLVKDFEGKRMWIWSKLVSDRIDCAVIKVNTSILRSGPGKKFAKTALGTAHKYMPFKKLDRDGAWLKLQDDYGYRHWVYENNLWEPLEYAQMSF